MWGVLVLVLCSAMVYNSYVHSNLTDLLVRDLDWGEQLPPELHKGSRYCNAIVLYSTLLPHFHVSLKTVSHL